MIRLLIPNYKIVDLQLIGKNKIYKKRYYNRDNR